MVGKNDYYLLGTISFIFVIGITLFFVVQIDQDLIIGLV